MGHAHMMMIVFLFFFFKQKTAYEMSIGDWSSDVCSSDLRRDHRIRLPLARAITRGPDGIPYAHPEIVLLFKARAPSAKDEADLTVTLPRLDRPARAWLERALQLVHPGHPWLAVLPG